MRIIERNPVGGENGAVRSDVRRMTVCQGVTNEQRCARQGVVGNRDGPRRRSGGDGRGEDSSPLQGTWSVQLDREDRGEAEQWFTRELSGAIVLPGVLTAQGYGDPVSMQTQWTGNLSKTWTSDPYYKQYQTPDNFKMPFWLQPDRHYVGAAWYQRQIEVPHDVEGQTRPLFLERPHWKTTVWLDGRSLGSKDSLGTPHVYELGTDVAPGKHRLTIRVDNRMIVDVGNNAHSVSDHTQGNWNGIVGRIELQATDPVWIDDVRVYPNVKDKTVKVKVSLGNSTGASGTGSLSVSCSPAALGWGSITPGGGGATGRSASVGPGVVDGPGRQRRVHLLDGQ